ncbi:MAG: hypothetical protein IPI94_14125 [Propionivibrio sp.]|nr:hypothetical protein [Propionivibrio sp.]
MMRMVFSVELGSETTQRQLDVLADGHRIEQGTALKGHAHVLAQVGTFRSALKRVMSQRAALMLPEVLAQCRADGATACSCSNRQLPPSDDHDLALPHREADVVENLPGPVVVTRWSTSMVQWGSRH